MLGNNSKRIKLNTSVTVWDDDEDIDIDALDECFERATQTLQREEQNVGETSVLPKYDIFKQPQFTSTQLNNSFTVNNNNSNLIEKLRDYEKKYAEKVGEVSILRLNLQEAKAATIQQSQKDLEWKEKLRELEKQCEEIKAKLEFKSFENSDLKQKIRNLQKSRSSNKTERAQENVNSSTSIKFELNYSGFCPAKNANLCSVFQLPNDVFYETWKDEEEDFISKLQTVEPNYINNRELNVDTIYPEINFLSKLTTDELNSKSAIESLTKVICVGLQFMEELLIYLEIIQDNIQPSQIKELDLIYFEKKISKESNYRYYPGDSRIKLKELQCSKVISFLATILPFSKYLNEFVWKNQLYISDLNSDYKNLKIIKQKDNRKLLETMLKIISLLGKLRKTLICSNFLKATAKFFTSIYNCDDVNTSWDFLVQVIREILFARPDFDVIVEIIPLMQVASRRLDFVNILCQNCSIENYTQFTPNMCLLHMYNILLENVLDNQISDELFLEYSNGIIDFIYNIIQLNPSWIFRVDGRSKCLLKLYTLYYLLMLKNLNRFVCNTLETKFKTFFKNNLRLLLLCKRNDAIFERRLFFQFTDIVYRLRILAKDLNLSETEVAELEALEASEPKQIDSRKFTGLNF